MALVGVCVYLLFNLLWHPKTYFVHLTATTYRPHVGQPLQFAFGDFRAFERLKGAVANDAFSTPPAAPLTRERLEQRLSSLSAQRFRKKDTLIVYLAAHGVVSKGEANLVCEPDGPWGQKSMPQQVPIATVLAALKNTSAGTKLLLLDAGQDVSPTRSGLAINTFPAALQREVDEAGDRRIWVFTANAPLERSHVSPSRGRSVFGHFVAEGLVGAADSNGDGRVDLDELYAYVQPNVSAWVRFVSDDNDSQTPLLLNSQSRESAPGVALLSIARLSTQLEGSGEQGGDISPNLVSASAIPEAAESAVPPQALDAVEKLGVAAADEEVGEAARLDGLKNDSAPGQSSSARSKVAVGRDGAQQALQNALAAAARLQKAGQRPLPSVFAPFLWRELSDRLFWYDQCCAADLAKDAEVWRDVAREVNAFHQSLEAYEKTEAEGSLDEVVNLLPKFAPRVPPNVASANHLSFALVEQVAQRDPRHSIEKKLNDFVAKYDALTQQEAGDASALAAIYGNKEQPTLEELKKYYEFQLLELASNVDVPWELTQQVLRTRRLGEQTAADLLCGQGWCRDQIESADALRLEGERLVLDQTSESWVEEANVRLDEAKAIYEQAQANLRLIDSAIQQRDVLLRQLPDLVRWVQFSPRSQQATDRQSEAVRSIMSCLAEVNQALANPSDASVAKLDDAMRALEQARNETDEVLTKSNTCWEKARLLATSLPAPDERLQLRRDVRTLEETHRDEYKQPNEKVSVLNTPSPTELQARQVARQLDL